MALSLWPAEPIRAAACPEVSGIFTYAKALGVLDGVNPVPGTLIPRKAAAPGERHATTPEEAIEILELLGRAKGGTPHHEYRRVDVFCCLRPGEARGARWENL